MVPLTPRSWALGMSVVGAKARLLLATVVMDCRLRWQVMGPGGLLRMR